VITYGSTFTGIRGLDLAFEHVLGARCAYSVERSAFCREIIWQQCGADHRIVRDIRDASRSTVPRTDAIIGGWPCPGHSDAGRRTGLEHAESGLWRELARLVDDVRPDILFLENVRGALPRGFDEVLADLALLGFDVRWTSLRASDVGAPHRRERIFILAHTNRGRLRLLAERQQRITALGRTPLSLDASPDGRVGDTSGERHTPEVAEVYEPGASDPGRQSADASLETVADPDRTQRLRSGLTRPTESEASSGRPRPRDGSQALGNADDDRRSERSEGDDNDRHHAQRRVADGSDAPHRWPPGPSDAEGWARWPGARPSFRRGPHGLPGWVDSARLADGLRRARLRALGNAVVRQQAEAALEQLLGELIP
jgi:DNA (cytosine-5)-methyltransferase 1